MSTVSVSSGTPTPKRNTKMPANSLDHLLNFSLPPRQSQQYQNHPRRRKPGTPAAVWNRERFVNAQYRFLMSPSGDYTVHFADPDIYFHWRDILQVIVPRTSATTPAYSGESSHAEDSIAVCPICLSPPTAPRMTKCGHIFCFPCILHYLNTSDVPKSARCPICLDTVNERELKAVKWIDTAASSSVEEDEQAPPTASSSSATADNGLSSRPRPGSTLRMRLIQRPQITTLALPRSNIWPSDLLPPLQAPFHFLPDVYHFAKFMLATPAALIADLTKDLDELATERRMLASMKDDLGVAFVDAADAKVRHQMEKAAALENPHLKHTIDAAYNSLHNIEDRVALNQAKERERDARGAAPEDVPDAFLASQPSAFSSHSTLAESQPSGPNNRDTKRRRNVNPPPPTSSYYFYQAATGMPIFLHPLDIKILLSHFNNYAAFPDTISVPLESYTESTVDDGLRKRCKYLSHLPAGADVAFVEVDLKPVVGQDGLKNFERPLAARRQRRKERERKDDKARARAEERERERVVENWNELTRHHVDSYIPPPAPRDPSPGPDLVHFPGPGESRPRPETVPASGAWGARSFASAAQHPDSGALIAPQRQPRQRQPNSRDQDADEWDLDLLFHEGGQRRGGGKRKNNRMVVLGGGGGRRR